MNPYIKLNCVICGKPITNPSENYQLRGNYCIPCNALSTGKNTKLKAKEKMESLIDKEGAYD